MSKPSLPPGTFSAAVPPAGTGPIPFATTNRGVKVRVLETGTIQVGRGSMPESEDSPMADAVYSLAAPGGGKLINVPASRRAELVAVIGDWS